MENNNKKEIIYIGDVGKPNTAPFIHAQNIARLFGKLGYHTTFICDNYNDVIINSDESKIFDYNYTTKYITIPKFSAIEWIIDELTGWKYRKLIKEKIKRNKPKFVLMYGYSGESWVMNYCHKNKIPFVIERVDWFEKSDRTGFIEKELIQRQVNKAILTKDKHVDGVISISRFFENYYHEIKVPTIFIPPIFEFKSNNINNECKRDNLLRLVYAGSVGGNKDYILPVLYVVKKINCEKIQIHLDIVGPTFEQINNITGENSWTEYGIEIHGRLSNQKAQKIIKTADFSFLLRDAKRYAKAGFSTKFAESMCLGVPVICTKVGGADSVITHMWDGICLNNNNVETIEEALLLLLNKSPIEIIQMKHNAYTTASRLFNIDSYIEKMDKFLVKLGELSEQNK